MTLDEIIGQVRASIGHVEEGNYIVAFQDLMPVLQDVIRVILKKPEFNASPEAEAKRIDLGIACEELQAKAKGSLEKIPVEKGSEDGDVVEFGRDGKILAAILQIIEKLAPLIPLLF